MLKSLYAYENKKTSYDIVTDAFDSVRNVGSVL